ncbi:MAG: hypothetical protein LIP01_11060, partial [Tannerellaceae bacterium]|nr:hypothetical protein [Tannerellaceae bacterium]
SFTYQDDYVIITGLTDNSSLIIKGTCGNNIYSENVTIHTEVKVNVPNGDFEEGWSEYYHKTINMNGRFGMKAIIGSSVTWRNNGNPLTKEVIVHSLSGWMNVNSKTMPQNATNENTWYIVPSTERTSDSFDGSNFAVKISNVGWDNTGENIEDYIASFNLSGNPTYSATIPNIKYRSAGKFFLGDYSYNYDTQMDDYDEGIVFTSRPSIYLAIINI